MNIYHNKVRIFHNLDRHTVKNLYNKIIKHLKIMTSTRYNNKKHLKILINNKNLKIMTNNRHNKINLKILINNKKIKFTYYCKLFKLIFLLIFNFFIKIFYYYNLLLFTNKSYKSH